MAAVACTSEGGSEPEPDAPEVACSDPGKAGCVVSSELKRDTAASVAAADIETLVEGNTTFALSLNRLLSTEPGNLFFSPYSISTALGMTYAGARNATETAMASTLHYTLPQAQLHPAFNALDLALSSRGQGAQGADGQPFRLHTANALWGQINFAIEAPFLDVLAQSYGAGVHVVDFVEQNQQAVDLINGWVEKKTEGKIKDLVSTDSVTPDTRLVLTNAVYFSAAWETPFEASATQPGTFTTQAGQAVEVPMMKASLEMDYAEGAGFQAVSMPYDGREMSMVVILPDDLATFEQSLDADKLADITGSMTEYLVNTEMPKFDFESEFSLKEALGKLGMENAFSAEADFTGIHSAGGLVISDVVHKAFVGVNEKGTEAAAATAVIMNETSAPANFADFHLNKPFLFLVRDNATNSVVFLGRVSDPS
ncbi:Serine protease inhibitor (serpin family) [Chondromyces apiculatus DSM 436]|uniref:Serine protease inhibitor (Serpin family) n=1 Tax=Chondromyces apiculatus DSM 436 TaxID=1192034 RepID=A0A017THI1_9BACT|nr:Serine protease inhibitor (serpin family) [Chondromyces apiculatus DSM 436]